MKRRRVLFVGLLSLFGACGKEPPCGGHVASKLSKAPRISKLKFEGTRALDPWLFLYRMDFKDSDGDLGAGYVFVYVNGSTEPFAYPMHTLLAQVALPDLTTTGSVGLPIRLQETSADALTLGMAVQLRDGQNHLSNCYTLEQTLATQED